MFYHDLLISPVCKRFKLLIFTHLPNLIDYLLWVPKIIFLPPAPRLCRNGDPSGNRHPGRDQAPGKLKRRGNKSINCLGLDTTWKLSGR